MPLCQHTQVDKACLVYSFKKILSHNKRNIPEEQNCVPDLELRGIVRAIVMGMSAAVWFSIHVKIFRMSTSCLSCSEACYVVSASASIDARCEQTKEQRVNNTHPQRIIARKHLLLQVQSC